MNTNETKNQQSGRMDVRSVQVECVLVYCLGRPHGRLPRKRKTLRKIELLFTIMLNTCYHPRHITSTETGQIVLCTLASIQTFINKILTTQNWWLCGFWLLFSGHLFGSYDCVSCVEVQAVTSSTRKNRNVLLLALGRLFLCVPLEC